MKKIKSKSLQPGAKIGVIAPASPVNSLEQINLAVSVLEEQGFSVVCGETVTPMNGDLAGDDLSRQADLERLWQDESISAIWCLRGGYGCIRLLHRLWFGLLAKTPKILMGFSDITALELGIWAKIKLMTFHGPVLTSLNSKFSKKQAFDMLGGGIVQKKLNWPEDGHGKFVPIKTGKAEGILMGGNLATITSLIGTSFFPSLEGVILFLEEAREEAYRIDRMLTQLALTGVLDSLAAVIVGRCIPVEGQTEMELIKVFDEKLKELNCPSAYGFPIGHLPEQWTIPQGILGEVDTTKGDLILLESPFY